MAVTLSAQATDVSVNKATDKLFPVANTPETIYALGVDGLKTYIKTIGLYNAKAENVIKACKMLIEKHNSIVPNNRADLEALPGVGRKTANVIASVVYNKPSMAVDTHVFRVSNRIGLTNNSKTPYETEKELTKNIPEDNILIAHHCLILHGRYTCKARKPDCQRCIIADLCEYPAKTVS